MRHVIVAALLVTVVGPAGAQTPIGSINPFDGQPPQTVVIGQGAFICGPFEVLNQDGKPVFTLQPGATVGGDGYARCPKSP